MTPDLSRYLEAQDSDNAYYVALQQIKEGDIQGNWMAFVFPSIYRVDLSLHEKKYAFYSLYEAEAFMCDPTLSERLRAASRAVIDNHYGTSLKDVVGYTNSLRIKECMTLFDVISPGDVFGRVLDNFFEGEHNENLLSSFDWEKKLFYDEESPYDKAGVVIIERAMFDSYAEETKGYSIDYRIATFLRLYRMGYTPLELGRLYLVNHMDIYNSYRTSAMESFLTYLGCELLSQVYEYTRNNCSSEEFELCVAQFDLRHYFYCFTTCDWEIYAIKLESLIAYIVGNPNYDDFVFKYEELIDKRYNKK